jgi:hypothetical protein
MVVFVAALAESRGVFMLLQNIEALQSENEEGMVNVQTQCFRMTSKNKMEAKPKRNRT